MTDPCTFPSCGCANPATCTPAKLTSRESELFTALVTARQMLLKARSMLQPGVFDRDSMKQVNKAITKARAAL